MSVMADVPSVAYRLPEYAATGVTGVTIGLRNLTQLLMGVDRSSSLTDLLFDETDDAVLETVSRIISRARQAGITSSITGLPRNRPTFVERLVRLGLSSLSVNPDELDITRTALNDVSRANLDSSI